MKKNLFISFSFIFLFSTTLFAQKIKKGESFTKSENITYSRGGEPIKKESKSSGTTGKTDTYGNPIVNETLGLPAWAQRDIDGFSKDFQEYQIHIQNLKDAIQGKEITNFTDLFGEKIYKKEISELKDILEEVQAVYANLAGQAWVRNLKEKKQIDEKFLGSKTVLNSFYDYLKYYESEKARFAPQKKQYYTPTYMPEWLKNTFEKNSLKVKDIYESTVETENAKTTPSEQYVVTNFARGMTNLTGYTTLMNGGSRTYDDEYVDQAIGFDFLFFKEQDATPRTAVRVGDNGYITFYEYGGDAIYGDEPTNAVITANSAPDGFIAPFWDDLYIINQGGTDLLNYKLEGSVGDRVATYEWYSASSNDGTTSEYHYFQIKLFEQYNSIEFHYGIWRGTTNSATIGIENYDGTLGDGGPNNLATNTTRPNYNYRFTPDGYGFASPCVYREDFELQADGVLSTAAPANDRSWKMVVKSGTTNKFYINNSSLISGAKSLSITNDNGATAAYSTGTTDIIAYYDYKINASPYTDLYLSFNYICNGETDYDYAKIVWSPDAVTWYEVADDMYQEGDNLPTGSDQIDFSFLNGNQFYMGVRWVNNVGTQNNYPFTIDDIVLNMYPDIKYSYSYRDDIFTPITGTVLELDGTTKTADFTLPSGFDFTYLGNAVSTLRVSENGWLEIGQTSTDEGADNNLAYRHSPYTLGPNLLAPLWDDLTADNQTQIIYRTTGFSPNRIFTVEWKDVLWNGKRQNFQVKLYETSDVIEFHYGAMVTTTGGSASIGISDNSYCGARFISYTNEASHAVSHDFSYNSIPDNSNLYEGLVFVFNPTAMQTYESMEAATIVVGQTDFTTQSSTINQSTASGANCSAVSSKNVMAIGSYYAGRVLLYNQVPTTYPNTADIVIGKNGFTDVTNGCTQQRTAGINYVAFTPDGNKMLVADSENNRVLIWNTIPTSSFQAADVVIGQNDFISSGANGLDAVVSNNGFNRPVGILVTPSGQLLIADFNNSRVLVYNSVPTTNGAAANYVIGQSSFSGSTGFADIDKLDHPWDVAFSANGKLLISDNGDNNRIMIYDGVPSSNGASAINVMGNTLYTTAARTCSRSTFDQPSVTTSVEGKVAVADFGNNRITIFNTVPNENGAEADVVLGQPNFNSATNFYDSDSPGNPTEYNMSVPYSINFDLNGRLLVNGTMGTGTTGMHRVMIFGETPTETADLALSFTSNASATVCIGTPIQYSVVVTNKGGDIARNVVVNASLPVGFSATESSTTVGSYNPRSGYWQIPSIAINGTATLTFTGKVGTSLGGTNITAYANIAASLQKDNDFSNNAASITLAVTAYYSPEMSAIDDFTINKNDLANPNATFTITDSDAGDTFTYTYTTSNSSLINATTGTAISGTEPNMNVNIVPETDQYGYSDIVIRATDTHSCYVEEPFTVAVGNIWEGGTTGNETDWNTAANWTGQVPTSTLEAIIPTTPVGGYYPVINSSANVHDLLIEQSASLTINDTYSLHVYNDIILESDANGTASLVDLNTNNGLTLDGTATVERYFTAGGWHYISSPVSNATSDMFTNMYGGGYYNPNFINYNENYAGLAANWLDGWEFPYQESTSTPGNITIGQGYGIYFDCVPSCEHTAKYSGAQLNSGTISIAVSNQDETAEVSGNKHRGWNLVGNPYPSGVNADEFISHNSSVIASTIYFWDEDGDNGFSTEGQDYASYNATLGSVGAGSGTVIPDKYISSGQGFFVHKTSSATVTENIEFTNAMRETKNSYFFKKDKKIHKVKLSVLNPKKHSNEIIVAFMNEASDKQDAEYDGLKIKGNSELAFYSINEGLDYAIQAYSLLDEKSKGKRVKLGLHAGIEGEYQFNVLEFKEFTDTLSLLLYDADLDSLIDLNTQKKYDFTIHKADVYNDRFQLVVLKSNEIENLDVEDFELIGEPQLPSFDGDWMYHSRDGYLTVYTNEYTIFDQITVYDLSGRLVHYEKVQSNVQQLDHKFKEGIYLLHVKFGDTIYKEKVFIE